MQHHPPGRAMVLLLLCCPLLLSPAVHRAPGPRGREPGTVSVLHVDPNAFAAAGLPPHAAAAGQHQQQYQPAAAVPHPPLRVVRSLAEAATYLATLFRGGDGGGSRDVVVQLAAGAHRVPVGGLRLTQEHSPASARHRVRWMAAPHRPGSAAPSIHGGSVIRGWRPTRGAPTAPPGMHLHETYGGCSSSGGTVRCGVCVWAQIRRFRRRCLWRACLWR
jgi:hypothetical protein